MKKDSQILDEKLILFRCDGTPETGLGHVSRCVALAESLGECGFVCRSFGRFGAGAADMLSGADIGFDFSASQTGGEEDLECTSKPSEKNTPKDWWLTAIF
jgi:hypothetical protein